MTKLEVGQTRRWVGLSTRYDGMPHPAEGKAFKVTKIGGLKPREIYLKDGPISAYGEYLDASEENGFWDKTCYTTIAFMEANSVVVT